MSNVLEFSNKLYTKAVSDQKEVLKELYDALKLCYDTIETLEDRIKTQEKIYDETFAKYVFKVGIENIEIGYLEYVSGDMAVNTETGEITYYSLTEEQPEDDKE